jgi:micrococcal nuclease
VRALIYLFVITCSATVHAQEFSGRVVRVHSGDSLSVQVAGKPIRVLLEGIDAPELRQAYGKEARQSLVDLCAGTTAKVTEKSKDASGRTVGAVICAGLEASHEQVRRGMAWVSARQVAVGSPLYELESYARLRKVGLWREESPVAPWIWRSKKKG